MSSNPFALLSGKKIRDQPKAPKSKKAPDVPTEPATKKAQRKAGEAAVVEPVKKGAVVTLSETPKAAPKVKKEEKIEQKIENAKTDRHDRSGKSAHVRKEGKGAGGWEDSVAIAAENAPASADWGTAAAEEPKAAPKEQKPETAEDKLWREEQQKKAEEEVKQREIESKQKTYEQYLEELKEAKDAAPKFNVRKVDDSKFKQMTKAVRVEEETFSINSKKAPAASKKPSPKAKAKAAPVEPKTTEKKAPELLGFRMEPVSAPTGGKGKGKGRGEGRGEGRGGRGEARGQGRGRGAGDETAVKAPAVAVNAPKVDDEEAFPSLGGATAAAEDQVA